MMVAPSFLIFNRQLVMAIINGYGNSNDNNYAKVFGVSFVY